jgi:hypothetical protein
MFLSSFLPAIYPFIKALFSSNNAQEHFNPNYSVLFAGGCDGPSRLWRMTTLAIQATTLAYLAQFSLYGRICLAS